MTTSHPNKKRVLAIDPASRGFGFAVLEEPERLIDWGVKESRDRKKSRTLLEVAKLVQMYHPDVIVLEDCKARGSRRTARIQQLIGALQTLAVRRGIPVRYFSLTEVKAAICHPSARTKQEMAAAIAMRLPELAQRVPPPRQAWMSEHYGMSLFDAVALGLTFFASRSQRNRTRR